MQFNRVPRRPALLAVLAVCLACLPCGAGIIRHDRSQSQYLDYANSGPFDAAGLFAIDRGGEPSTGSGVLIGNGRWVLTAAHLLAGTRGMSFEVGGQTYAADGWVAHPRYDGDFRRGYDLGLVRLSAPVGGVMPAGLYRGRRELGREATLVGFGLTGTGLTGAQPPAEADRLARAGTNVIDGTTGKTANEYRPRLPGGARVLITDFDSPMDPSVSTTGDGQPTDLELLISQGDSGGPLYIDVGDGRGAVVAGIHSYGEFRDDADDSDYGDVTGHIRVSLLRGWIEKILRRDAAGRAIPDFVTSGEAGSLLVQLIVSPASSPSVTAMPEPAGVVWLLAGSGLLARRRPRP